MDGSKQLARGGAGGEAPPSSAQAPPSSSQTAAAARAAAGDDGEVDDEQVERFYALLANIRAMRGVYGYGAACDDDGDGGETDGGGGGGAARRKRARHAEPPWRPVFRIEDFDEPSPPATDDVAAPCPDGSRRHGDEAEAGEQSRARPAAGAAATRRRSTARRRI
ncbi:hypothetical protein ACP4OV_016137 [Aristida adscensionis]